MRSFLLLFLLLVCTSLSGKTYYVATYGKDTNNGASLLTPFATWQRGINVAYPGDTIFIRGGVYYLYGNNPWVSVNTQTNPAQGRTGTQDNPICFWAYPADYEIGNHPILDCSKAYETYGTNFSCFGLNGVQYWHIKGLTIRNAYQRGVAGCRPQGFGATNAANIIFENCTAHNISARGFYYESGAWNTWDGTGALWSSDTTYYINCDAYDIRDSVNCSAGDGWKCGNYFGGVMYFTGCRAWNYSDDGFDPGGAGKRIFRNCWAMSTDKYSTLCGGDVETNGFKTGAIGMNQVSHYPSGYMFVEFANCIAAFCDGVGFYNNLELGVDNNARFVNNTAYKNKWNFFDMPIDQASRGSEYRNNIAYGSTDPNYSQVGIYRPSVYVESNNTWIATQMTGSESWPGWILNNAYNVTDADFVSLDGSQLIGPRKSDGSLPEITFLKLVNGSDLIDAGINVGLPYAGSAPDIGYSEYGSVSVNPPVPTLVSAAIQNATQTKLEMIFSLTLANIIPVISSFTVKVNSAAVTVNSVIISGTKVTLTLASPVIYGDAVTVAYVKPTTNPLQTPDGGQVETLSTRNVTNYVAAPTPVYVSSVVENATPARLEITYNLTLANITPTASSFVVKVNTVSRAVSSVAVSGTKVHLTLSSPVSYGDAVTVAYTKPSTNPLQTVEGGQAASITAQNVINNCSVTPNQPPVVNISSPTKNSAFISPATITIDAVASDPDGTIVKVEFFNGQSKLGEKTTAPYSFTWKEVPEGSYIITAAAVDNMNARTVSSSVTVVVEKAAEAVNQLPVVTLKNPNKGRKFKKNETIVLEAEATDPDGTISKVEFKSGNVTLAELTEAPYIFLWQNVDTGRYMITAYATDNLGAVSQTTEVEVSVLDTEVPGFGIINIYPNPSDGHFAVNMSGQAEGDRKFTIYNLAGQAMSSELRPGQEATTNFNFPEILPGTYILAVSSGNKIIDSRKFIKR